MATVALLSPLSASAAWYLPWTWFEQNLSTTTEQVVAIKIEEPTYSTSTVITEPSEPTETPAPQVITKTVVQTNEVTKYVDNPALVAENTSLKAQINTLKSQLATAKSLQCTLGGSDETSDEEPNSNPSYKPPLYPFSSGNDDDPGTVDSCSKAKNFNQIFSVDALSNAARAYRELLNDRGINGSNKATSSVPFEEPLKSYVDKVVSDYNTAVLNASFKGEQGRKLIAYYCQ